MKDWGQEEKGTTEDEMAGWHHQLDGHGFGWISGLGDEQGGLACCDSWGHKADFATELNFKGISSFSFPNLFCPHHSLLNFHHLNKEFNFC